MTDRASGCRWMPMASLSRPAARLGRFLSGHDRSRAGHFDPGGGRTVVTGENFSVQARATVPMYDVITYSYLDPVSRSASYNPAPTRSRHTGLHQHHARGVLRRGEDLLREHTGAAVGHHPGWLCGSQRAISQAIRPAAARSRCWLCTSHAAVCGSRSAPHDFQFRQRYVRAADAITLVQKGAPVVSSVAPNIDGSGNVTVTAAVSARTAAFLRWHTSRHVHAIQRHRHPGFHHGDAAGGLRRPGIQYHRV